MTELNAPAPELSTLIYQRLDALTGGIEEWLANEREEVWRSGAYMPFHIATIWTDRLMFGFRRDDEDVSPDLVFSITIAGGRVDLNSLVTDTGLGYRRGDVGGAGQDCADFLAEVLGRQQAGIFTDKTVHA